MLPLAFPVHRSVLSILWIDHEVAAFLLVLRPGLVLQTAMVLLQQLPLVSWKIEKEANHLYLPRFPGLVTALVPTVLPVLLPETILVVVR